MKRFACLVVLMALTSPACGRDYSFVFHGHDIHIAAARHCRSLSCVSVLFGDRHNRRDRDGEVATMRDGGPVSPPPSVQAQRLPAPMQTVPAARPPTVAAQPAVQPIKAPMEAPAQEQPAQPAPMAAKVEQPAAIEKPQAKPQSKPQLAAPVEETESDAETPIGDWRTDAKANRVRIESCGTAFCGFVLDAATHSKGETILINMKPKRATGNGPATSTAVPAVTAITDG
jgi:hypothetical protein